MHCDFCGEDIEGVPFHKEGMSFCSQECADAMETGESLPMGEDVLDDPDELDDDFDDDETDDDDDPYSDDYADDDLSAEDEKEF